MTTKYSFTPRLDPDKPRRRRLATAILIAALCALSFVVAVPLAAADTAPSGERTFGQTVVEPAYNDANGQLVYLSTPMHVKVHPNFAHNVAPIYLPVYPAGSSIVSTTLNCQHTPVENCPDHGDAVAGAAAAIVPSVYGGGVLGHDHLVGIASTGGDFNVLWEPVIVLFTNAAAANEHIVTLDQINAAVARGDAILIDAPSLTFNCSVVSAAVYNHGTPYILP